MIPGDFQFSKPSKRDLIKLGILGGVGFAGFVLAALVLTFVISAWMGRSVIFGYDEGPEQPIAFPHTTHVEDLGLDCIFCHRNVTKGESASIPAVGLCLTCHQNVGDGLPEIEKLRLAFEENRPINWVRVHRLPDHVQFVHDAHIKRFSGSKIVVDSLVDPSTQMRLDDARKIEPETNIGETVVVAPSEVCIICHGDVGSMTKVKQVRPLKMGDCVDCHRDNAAPTDCTTCHY